MTHRGPFQSLPFCDSEIWLYCTPNLSQDPEVKIGAKYVEKKSLQSNLVKAKIERELHKIDKT